MSKYSELSLIPLQCSQGGIPYNKEHLDAKDRRIAELEAENERLRRNQRTRAAPDLDNDDLRRAALEDTT